MPAGTQAIALIELPEAADRQPLHSRANVDIRWLERNGEPATDSHRLEHALHELSAVEGDSFYWIAAESGRARAMRQWLDQRGVPKDWIKATGYWKAGADDDED
jgi:NADPH-dependent ferric siderophore reductase